MSKKGCKRKATNNVVGKLDPNSAKKHTDVNKNLKGNYPQRRWGTQNTKDRNKHGRHKI